MTLKAIESEFAELLEGQMKENLPLDLSLEAPLMNKLHPKLIWATLVYKHNPQQEPPDIEIPGFDYECFENLSRAAEKYPGVDLKFPGRPWTIHKYLTGTEDKALIDFAELGAVLLSRNEQNTKRGRNLHDHLLPVWLSYALSPELWGPVGKWPRFHDRIIQIFKQYNILDEKASLGYYPLNARAEKLEALGFPGTRLEKGYLIVLPWTFSLYDLEKLETVIRQEF